MTTVTIIRDTNYSFIKTTTLADGASFSRKLQSGSSEYTNAAYDFYQAKVALTIGNQITE